MKNEIEALRRRVNAERRVAGENKVRFSTRLKTDVVTMLDSPDWGPTRLGRHIGIVPSVLERWKKLGSAGRAKGRLKKVRVATESQATRSGIELVFPSGATVRGLSIGQIAQLVGGRS